MDIRQAISISLPRRDSELMSVLCLVFQSMKEEITYKQMSAQLSIHERKVRRCVGVLEELDILTISKGSSHGHLIFSFREKEREGKVLVKELSGELNRAQKLSLYLWNKLSSEHGDLKVLQQADAKIWEQECDKIIRVDNRPPAEVARVIEYLFTDKFWRTKIQTPHALRKHYDKLVVNTRETTPTLKTNYISQ